MKRKQEKNSSGILMLLTNAFDPDPRVHQEAVTLVKNGYDVTILCWDRDLKHPGSEIIDGIRIERIYVRSTHARGTSQMLFLFLFWLKALKRAIKRKFSIVHCHDFDTLPLGFLISRCLKTKLVYDSHESYVDMLTNLPAWLKLLIYHAENFLIRRTNLLITVGELLRDHLMLRGARRSCVVGNWKDPAKFKFSENLIKDERKRLNIADSQSVISFVANLGYERQLPPLIEAVKDSSETFLVVGGDGPAKALVQTAAEEFDNICFLGFVHPSRVPFYTAIADVVFYGFDPYNPNARFSAPNKLFEAIAAGKAVITGDFGEIARIVKENECGIVLDGYSVEKIKSAIIGLKPDRLKTLKENARKAAELGYSWQLAEKILLDNYKGLRE